MAAVWAKRERGRGRAADNGWEVVGGVWVGRWNRGQEEAKLALDGACEGEQESENDGTV